MSVCIYPSESEEKQGIKLDIGYQNTEWSHHVNIIELLPETWLVHIPYSS